MVNCLKIIALFALVSCIVIPVVSAINVSFADPDATTHRDVYVYGSDGALDGVYNTTSAGIEITGDSIFVIKPQYSSPLDEPGTWLTATMSWASTNVVSLVVIVTLIGLLLSRH